MTTRRMTVGQALAEFLARQWTVDGEIRERTIPAVFGIFGHGNVAGVGQALEQLNVQQPDLLPYHQARSEQAMVHQAVGYARVHRRRSTFACTASVGPGAANMLTGAALATANRLPALLLPSDAAATRTLTDPVETGAVTIALPEDVQAQAADVPVEFLADREWHIRRPLPEPGPLARAAAAIRAAKAPFIVGGGGAVYAGAED